jgi:ArsR family transcriptional regulator, arsenate/arsenite/antimonite-responsive transcriptional repressor
MTVYVNHIDTHRYVNYALGMECCDPFGCEPLCCEPLASADADAVAATLKALADPTRLRLYSLIASSDEQCACDLTGPLDVSQPTVSHHLKVLTEAGLVSREQRGKWAFYRANTDRLRELSRFLEPVGGLRVS